MTTPANRTHRLAPVLALAMAVAACLWMTTASVAVPPGGPVDRANGAKVKLHKSKVVRGGKIKVSGRNWKSKGSRLSGRAEVTVKIDDTHILAVLKIKRKRFSGWVYIPRQIKAGRHWLRFLAAKPATSIKRNFRVVRR